MRVRARRRSLAPSWSPCTPAPPPEVGPTRLPRPKEGYGWVFQLSIIAVSLLLDTIGTRGKGWTAVVCLLL